MSNRGVRFRPRVWCFTPHPVFETKIESPSGRIVCTAGGKGHNVARQLCRWGIPAISVIGEGGAEAEAWRTQARADGVRVRRIPVQVGMREGWALVRRGDERMDFFTEDLKIRPSEWKKIRNFWIRNCQAGDWWLVAGSSATGWPKGWWQNLIGDLQKKGVSVLVDSRGALLREAVEAGADWIKCNLQEAEETTGCHGIERCILSLRGKGTTGVVVTLGKKGMVAEVNGSRISMPAPKVRVRDATGSGDVVTAALIYGEMRGWTTRLTWKRAVRAGARNAASEATANVPGICLWD